LGQKILFFHTREKGFIKIGVLERRGAGGKRKGLDVGL